ncbi:MAG: ferredoxin [Candidatus Omnitrophota bacterium]|nr:ferredoxin [Candidatus Omnitrophota bacterium]MBU2528766.1 ferredoxin [bacterium]MBU3929120.1 ferredoxin [bacterium]MBU4123111.1 ferredoxin [bacterium]MDO9513518.1 ferredoxin [Elusimicrobiota bacterium]
MRVTIDADLCTGCSLCEQTVPEVFEIVDGVAVVKGAVTVDKEEDVTDAAENCPVDAINIE